MSKSLIFCFDGTSNHPSDAKLHKEWFGFSDEVVDKNITNILKLHILFGGNLENKALSSFQHSFYYSGVGTYGGFFEKMLNVAFAPENLDVSSIMNQAINDLLVHYQEGDKIFVFGFSRGAAIARRFCSVMHKYLGYNKPIDDLVEFLGVFDTVASIGKPNLNDENKPISDVVFENGTISDNIKRALHLLSLDEKRVAFQPTLMNADKRVKEVWFSGVHSDIGGGFYYDGLSDVTLDYMLNEIIQRQLRITILDVDEINFNALKTDTYCIEPKLLFINVNHLGKLHEKHRNHIFSNMTLCDRTVRVNEFDEPSAKRYPIVYYSVKQRIENLQNYRPSVLQDKSYYIEYENSFYQTKGFSEYKFNKTTFNDTLGMIEDF